MNVITQDDYKALGTSHNQWKEFYPPVGLNTSFLINNVILNSLFYSISFLLPVSTPEKFIEVGLKLLNNTLY